MCNLKAGKKCDRNIELHVHNPDAIKKYPVKKKITESVIIAKKI